VAKVFIGTSGYDYPHWRKGVFYPDNLSNKQELSYYSQRFSTVELNNPFYRLPEKETFSHWAQQVPPAFVFSVKVSRYLTHFKKLAEAKEPWEIFFSRAQKLGIHQGPFLFQFPASWKINQRRLQDFVKMILASAGQKESLRLAFEFRHPSWFNKDIYAFFQQTLGISLVVADSPHWPKTKAIYGSFAYLRMHGPSSLNGASYSKKTIQKLAEQIRKYLEQDLDTYIYFNNDAQGWAVENALTLQKFFRE